MMAISGHFRNIQGTFLQKKSNHREIYKYPETDHIKRIEFDTPHYKKYVFDF